MMFARVNGVVLHFSDSAASGKPALVFSNSLGTDFRIWDAVVARLGDSFRIVRYDKRGHGLSEATPAPYQMDDHIGDLEALLGHLGITSCALVGLSVGGVIAQGLAAKRPGLVKALVLSGTAPKIGTAELWNQRIGAVAEGGVAALAEGVMPRWFTPAYRSPDNPDFVGYTAMLARTTADGYAGTCAALRDVDLTEQTKALKLPTLCMVGDQDGSTPPDLVRATAAMIRGAEFRIIADAGHIPCVERPEAVATLIATFLKQVRFS